MARTRILHLEDCSLDAELVLTVLRDGGVDADVELVETAAAFAAALNESFDLILADYALPAFDGRTALSLTRARYPDLPFIFVSGTLGEETAIETLKSGATDYVLKHRLARLVPAVRRALREARIATERKLAERRLTAEHAVTRILADAPHLEQAASGILAAICESLDCELAQWWQVDAQATLLRCIQAWRSPGFAAEEFEQVSRQTAFRPGIGLPGRVWTSKRPEWIPDVRVDTNFPRAPIAARAGLCTGVAFPILSGEQCPGVMEFLSRRSFAPDPSLLEMMAAVGSEIGQFVRRKHAEEALRESEQRYRFLTEALPQMIWTATADARVDFCNRHWLNFTGLTVEQTLGAGWTAALHPDDVPRALGRWRQAAEAGEYFEIEYRVRRASDGSYRWHIGRVLPLRNEAGRIVRFLGTAADIDDRRRTEQELRDSRQRLELMADGVPACVWAAAPDGAITYANRRWYEFSGLTPEQTARNWIDVIHPADRARCARAWEFARRSGDDYSVEVRNRRVDGVYRWFLTSARALRDEHGDVTGWFGTSTDIDDLKGAEDALRKSRARLSVLVEQLARSNKELDDFAYIASHDLKEPLRGIHNYATFLMEDYAALLDADGLAKIETLIRLTQRMDALIDSLLEYSRVGRVQPELGETDLNLLLSEILDSLHISLEQRGVDVRMPRPLPTLRCDRLHVGEVFRNLITNAMKYNDKPDKWIEIGYTELERVGPPPAAFDDDSPAGGDGLVLYVRDNGIGICPEHHASIFRIFRRLHARDEFGGGAGAGLTICKKIVERHGGRIWVDSTPAEGTTFYFTLQENPHVGMRAVHSAG